MKNKLLLMILVLSLSVLVFGCQKQNKADNTAGVSADAKAGSEAKQESNASSIPVLTSKGYDELLEKNKGKVVVVNFFGTWCTPCRKETPHFVSIYDKYKDKNFVIIGVAVDSEVSKVENFVDEFGVTYPTYIANNDLLQRFKVYNIPVSQIIDKNGELVTSKLGEINENLMEKIAQTGSR